MWADRPAYVSTELVQLLEDEWVNRRGSTKLHFVLDLENEGEKVNNVIKKSTVLADLLPLNI